MDRRAMKRRRQRSAPSPTSKRKKSYALERQQLWDHGFRACHYCSIPLTMALDYQNTLTVDHFIPLSRKGLNEWSNYRAACFRCNNIKGDMLPDEFNTFIIGET